MFCIYNWYHQTWEVLDSVKDISINKDISGKYKSIELIITGVLANHDYTLIKLLEDSFDRAIKIKIPKYVEEMIDNKYGIEQKPVYIDETTEVDVNVQSVQYHININSPSGYSVTFGVLF